MKQSCHVQDRRREKTGERNKAGKRERERERERERALFGGKVPQLIKI